ncbi:zinc uptake protein ZrgA [Vibrio ostreicida]|uniref:zinc uptake protein ZrgA n=1 Tax=Vibrio ostreicida TaxID=526588 RepID=UPI0009706498|nr:DUF2796 domain-containing protein [Vibrio ostreicida]
MHSITKIATLIGLTFSTSSFAEEHFRQHDAHVHGHVEFNIAQDQNELLVEITAPGADVVGFEHAPNNSAQEQALEKAVAQLNNASAILTLSPDAKCKLSHQSVQHTLRTDEHEHEHEHEKHDEHKHHEEHSDHDEHKHHEEHSDHDEHKHHEEHSDHDEHKHHEEHSDHGEFTVQYHYQCDNFNALSSINTQWFSAFPSTQSINVNLLTDKTQSAVELSAKNTKISL